MTDIFERTRAAFALPEGVIYLDGNSLGPMMHTVRDRLACEVTQEWGPKLVSGWNRSGWIDLPARVGDKIARLIGAPEGSVIAADSTSVNLYKVLTAALPLVPEGRVVLSDSGNFPSDLYVAQSALAALDKGHVLRIVEPEAVAGAIDESVAVVMLTEVDYRTGRRHDMKALTERAHAAGALTVWDLAHSAGAFPVDLTGANADFAIGCGYKYLNGGPGAPAFVYVNPRLQDRSRPALAAWMGHSAPFAFEQQYRPAEGIDRMRVGTPPILSLAALDAALDIWDDVDTEALRDRSILLSERFIAEIEQNCPQLELVSPRDPSQRGSQVSFRFEHGYAAIQAAIEIGVIGDFRAPDIMRFGFTPLYLSEADVVEGARRIAKVMDDALWQNERYRTVSKVT